MANKPKARRKVIVPIIVSGAILIGGIGYLLSQPPKPAKFKWQTSRNEQFNNFVEEKDNVFYDYLIAARLHKEMNQDLREEYSSLIYPKITEIERIGPPYPLGIVNKLKTENSSLASKRVESASNKLREYVEKEKPVIVMLKEGIAKKNCVVPETNNFGEISPCLPERWLLLDLGHTLVAQARIKEIDGDFKGAYEDYINAMKFGNDLSRGGALSHSIFNVNINLDALHAMHPGLKNLDAATLETVLDGLKEVEDSFVPCSEILKKCSDAFSQYTKYLIISRSNFIWGFYDEDTEDPLLFDLAKSNLEWIDVLFNKERIRRNIKIITERMIEYADKPHHKGEKEEFYKDLPVDEHLSFFSHDLWTAKKNHALNYANLRGIKLRAAVELYQRKHNELPQSLEALVSEGIIEQVQMDPFDGELFKYIDRKIYSVGPDFTDDKALVKLDPIKEKWHGHRGDMIF